MKKNGRKKRWIIFLIVLLLLGVVVGNLFISKESRLHVQVDTVKRMDIVQKITGSGILQPVTEVKISANVSGRIMRMGVKEGDSVKKGDFLVELERERYLAAVERSRSLLQSAEANLRKVESEFRRVKALFNKKLASEADLESAQAQLELARAEVAQARANLRQSKDDLDKTHIVSPMDGVVTSVRKEVGEIALGSTFQEDVIMVVSDLSRMEVKVEIDETDVVNITRGDSAIITIDAFPDTTFTGHVTEIAHSAVVKAAGTQEQVSNFPVKIELDRTFPRIRPGMSATVDIVTAIHENALGIPIQALTVREQKSERGGGEEKKTTSTGGKTVEVVFVVVDSAGENPEKTPPYVEQREIQVGISSNTHYEVLSGLKEGDKIVVGDFRVVSKELKDGDLIEYTTSGKGAGEDE